MSTRQLIELEHSYIDVNGLPYAGGTMKLYTHGSTTHLSTNVYSDSSKVYPCNPVILDAEGKPKNAIYFEADSGEHLDCLIYDADGVLRQTYSDLGFIVNTGIVTNITSQDGSLTTTVHESAGVKTVDLKITNNTAEYGTFHGTAFTNLTKDNGNMSADSVGIVCAKATLYHVMLDITYSITNLATDSVKQIYLSVDGVQRTSETVDTDASLGSSVTQRLSCNFDTVSGASSDHIVLALTSDAGVTLSISRIDVQIHRIVSTVTNPISQSDYNVLYYGTGLSTNTLAAAKTASRKVLFIKSGAAPVAVNATEIQQADTEVSESEYEEMEEAGTLDPNMRYVIYEDTDSE